MFGFFHAFIAGFSTRNLLDVTTRVKPSRLHAAVVAAAAAFHRDVIDAGKRRWRARLPRSRVIIIIMRVRCNGRGGHRRSSHAARRHRYRATPCDRGIAVYGYGQRRRRRTGAYTPASRPAAPRLYQPFSRANATIYLLRAI